MKMITTKDLNAKCFEYMLNAIDGEDYEVTLRSDKEKVQFVIDTFKKEYGFQSKRVGIYKAFSEWLMCLPTAINIDFENYRILEIAIEWGSIPSNYTNKQAKKILRNWFNLITNKFFQLAKKLKVEV